MQKGLTLITGTTGFLGRLALEAAQASGRHVLAVGRHRTSDGTPHLTVDLRSPFQIPQAESVTEVLHLAGKAHSLPRTDLEHREFFAVNSEGTRNLLRALGRSKRLRRFVLISTVAVYGVNAGENVSESHPCAPTDSYGQSKLDAEKAVRDWCTALGMDHYVFRPPLIVASNPPGNLNAMIRALKRGYYLSVASNTARRSMVLAADLVRFMIQATGPSGTFHLTDSVHPHVVDFERALSLAIRGRPPFALPKPLLEALAGIGDLVSAAGLPCPWNTRRFRQLTTSLTFDDTLAQKGLNWRPHPVVPEIPRLFP